MDTLERAGTGGGFVGFVSDNDTNTTHGQTSEKHSIQHHYLALKTQKRDDGWDICTYLDNSRHGDTKT